VSRVADGKNGDPALNGKASPQNSQTPHEGINKEGDIMKDTLKPGIAHEFRFRISTSKTVPALYPEADEFQAMPEVLATGYMVGFIEWACIQAINPHLNWPEEQSVGTHIDVSHLAATPPGLELAAQVRLLEVDRRRLLFEVEVHDGVDLISRGKHERFIIDKAKFDAKMKEKVKNKSA
jgi:fluoroacetyl-CoA thioesterase